jgi:hypothetical protein
LQRRNSTSKGSARRPGQFTLTVRSGKCGLEFDKAANIRSIAFGDKKLVPPSRYSYLELDSELAQAEHVPNERDLALRLTTHKAAAIVTVTNGKDIRFRISPEGRRLGKEVALVLTFPISTVFHLAEYLNTGRQVDSNMPIGQSYTAQLRYNFFLAECDGMWIRLRAEYKNLMGRGKVNIVRCPEVFTSTFFWPADIHT